MTTRSPLTHLLSGVLGGLVVLVVGSVLIATDVIDTGETKTVVRETPATQPTTSTSTDSTGRTPRDIYKQEGRGVVFIQSQGVSSDSESPFGAPQQGTATGSGFVVDDQGTIITNAHVVEGADSVQVRFDENGDFVDADVKGVDTSTDIAVLKIDPSDVSGGLTPIPLGDSSKAQVGDPVIAIGNPFGYSRTVTTGIVSGLQREITAPDGFQISNVIQTDASINPGNSGGPLLDADGRVIGINSQIATGGGQGSVGIGFAIPVNTAKQLLPQLEQGGEVQHAWLGVQMTDVNQDVADELDLPVDKGALVVEATQGGPADDAGLHGGDSQTGKGGDLIVSVDGKAIESSDDLAAAIASKKPGDKVEIEYYRGNDKKSVEVELGERPDSTGQQAQQDQPQDDGGGLFGLP
jgi:S1-C subfamily serine protease